MLTRRILVLGGGGYIGSVLVPKLLNRGWSIVVVDLFLHGNHLPDRHVALTCIRGDFRDNKLVRDSVAKCDSVIHLAGVSIDGATIISRKEASSINREAIEPLLRVCIREGVGRFVFASSCSVYGRTSDCIIDETVSARPLTLYGQWKLECEEQLFRNRKSMCITSLRAATACGSSPRQRFDLLVNRMVAGAFVDGEIIVEDDSAVRPAVHVEDLADAYI